MNKNLSNKDKRNEILKCIQTHFQKGFVEKSSKYYILKDKTEIGLAKKVKIQDLLDLNAKTANPSGNTTHDLLHQFNIQNLNILGKIFGYDHKIELALWLNYDLKDSTAALKIKYSEEERELLDLSNIHGFDILILGGFFKEIRIDTDFEEVISKLERVLQTIFNRYLFETGVAYL